MHVERIISGAQTGADRAALDEALAQGMPSGGWVPRGRLAEDGIIPPSYPNLRECDEAAVEKRTELNVLEADATLILTHGPLHGGSDYTRRIAVHHRKPALHIDLSATSTRAAVDAIVAWLTPLKGTTLNVAGPRASDDPLIYQATRSLLGAVLNAMRINPSR